MKQQDKIKLYEALDKNDVTKKIKYCAIDGERTRVATTYVFGDYKLIFSKYASVRGNQTMWIIKIKRKNLVIASSFQTLTPDKELYSLYVAVRDKSMGKEYKKPVMNPQPQDTEKIDMHSTQIRFNNVMSYELSHILPSEFMPFAKEISSDLSKELTKIILRYSGRTK